MSEEIEPTIVSYSELDTYRQCPLKHRWGYVERWTRPVKEGSALDKGTLWHNVMETHYQIIKRYQDRYNGVVPEQLVEKVKKRIRQEIAPYLRDMVTGEQSEVQALIEWMYDGYVELYGLDPQWRIIATEHQIITPLRDRAGNATRWHLKAKIDLLILDRELGTRWVLDHKSCSDLPDYMALDMDDQFGLYCWAMAEVKRPVQGALHSAARTKQNVGDKPGATTGKAQTLEQRFRRTYMPRSKREMKLLALDAYYVASMARPTPEAAEHIKVYSSPDPRQCGWKCDFKEVHLTARKSPQRPARLLEEGGFHQDFRRH